MARQDAEAVALLESMPAEGPHGTVLIERLRFGPPETWAGWLKGHGKVAVKLYCPPHLPVDLERRAAFRHPCVAPLLAWGPDWTVHAWAEGARPRTPLAPATKAVVADALAALHTAGLAHGDLKPANLAVSPAGPVLIDWGDECAGTPGWRPSAPHGLAERDLFALSRL